MSELERLKVDFNGRFHDQNNCICDCCHGIGNVAILEIPKTKYRGKGIELKTKYKYMWICDDCRKGLTTLLNRLEQIKEQTDGC